VKVIQHAVRLVQADSVLLDPFGKTVQETPALGIIPEQTPRRRPTRLALHTRRKPIPHHATGDMTDRSGGLYSQLPRQAYGDRKTSLSRLARWFRNRLGLSSA
jgi:hypothetical protein